MKLVFDYFKIYLSIYSNAMMNVVDGDKGDDEYDDVCTRVLAPFVMAQPSSNSFKNPHTCCIP